MRSYLLIFFSLCASICLGQGSNCNNLQPFCADNSGAIVFPNSNPRNSTEISAEEGPDYYCLEETPFPSWFFMQIDKPGDLSFRLSQNTEEDFSGRGLDVDFIVWGPFTARDDLCNYEESLNYENIVSCGFSEFPIEHFQIIGAQSDEIYVVLITNYAGQQELDNPNAIFDSSGYIKLEQLNLGNAGAGSTDCSILNGLLGENIQTCDPTPITLDATYSLAQSYEWQVDFGSGYQTIVGEASETFTVDQTGNYKLIVTRIDGDLEEDSISIEYLTAPTAGTPQDLQACEDDNSSATFDLTVQDAVILGSQDPALHAVKYFNSLADAEDDSSAIDQPQSYTSAFPGETIYSRLNAIGREETCYDITSFDLIVDAIPEITQQELLNNGDQIICLNANGFLLGEDLGSDYVYDWTPNNDQDNDGVEEPIFNVITGGTYTLQITNSLTGCISEVYTARFVEQPVANKPADMVSCESEVGVSTFDLTSQEADILGDQDPSEFDIRFFTSQADAEALENVIADPENYTSQERIVYARVDYVERVEIDCYDLTSFNLVVNQNPFVIDPYFENESSFICVDSSGVALNGGVLIGEDLGSDFTYDWTPDNDLNNDGVEEPIFNVQQGGTYSLVVIDNSTGCQSEQYLATFQASGPPSVVSVIIETDSFSENGLHTVSVETEGGFSDFPYEFALDDELGPYQESNVFTGVIAGDHIVYVRDINSCGVVSSAVFTIMDYPRYFSPNADGINDTWNIKGLDPQVNGQALIYIFDRYGKLLKQINPFGEGWDGTYRGKILPATDYWFRIEYIEPRDQTMRSFKAHFALKR